MAGSVAESEVRIREDEAEKPELTGEEVDLGGHGPLKRVRKVPKSSGGWRCSAPERSTRRRLRAVVNSFSGPSSWRASARPS